MKIALFTDIHANREAFDAVRAQAAEFAVDRYVLLGDLVGYGPDPAYVIERAMELVASGAMAVLGNHDAAALNGAKGMSAPAAAAIAWTERQLSATHRAFLSELAMSRREGDVLYVHASAGDPATWPYMLDASEAAASLAATDARLTFCGHTHRPVIFHRIANANARKPEPFLPIPNRPFPFSRLRRYVTVVGSVGQPRDHNSAACWGLYDTDADTITMMRIGYDIDATVRKINDAGLPEWLGRRLYSGR